MKFIEWDHESFTVGIAKMDEEHKKLVDLINALHARKDDDDKFVEKILNTLVLYTQIHFSHEEKILQKMHYPNFDAHHKEHNRFIGMVNQIKIELKSGADRKVLLNKITEFLRNWLLHHIMVEDRRYYEFLTN